MHLHQMEKLDATGKDAMFGENDINFDLQLEKFGVDTSILKEPAVQRNFALLLVFRKTLRPPSDEDKMRDATARTRSLISGMREEAAKRAAKLKLELSDLEMSLGSLRREAVTVRGVE